MITSTSSIWSRMLAILTAQACLSSALLFGQEASVDADFENLVPDGGANLFAVSFLSGNVAAPGKDGSPTDGQIYLVQSRIGQPVAGLPAQILGEKTYLFGEPILPAPTLGVDATLEPLVSPAENARWIPGLGQLIAAAPGFVDVRWIRPDKTTNSAVRYQVTATPFKDPVLLFHTHQDRKGLTSGLPPQLNVPLVQLPNTLKASFYFNSAVPEREVTPLATNYFLVQHSIGDTTQLECAERTGLILLEYRDLTGAHKGLEIVDIHSPSETPGVLSADLGDRLLSANPRSSSTKAIPFVASGSGKNNPGFVYQHNLPGSAQEGEVYAIQATRLAQAGTVPVEIFWRLFSLNNVVWPYERSRYTADWPTGKNAKYQLYVRDERATHGPDVLMPSDLGARLEAFQEPAGHAQQVVGNSFSTTGEGWSLLHYTPNGGKGVAFQVVRSVLHSKTNDRHYDGTTGNGTIGEEIRESSHQGPRPGYIHLPEGDEYDWEIYDGKEGDPASFLTHQIIPVNEGILEVWWSNVDGNGIQWPSLVKRYQNQWPVATPKIVLASNVGTGPLDNSRFKDLRLYWQNDPQKHGFNPNDEHAKTFDGRTFFALRNDLGGANSKPFVLIKYHETTPSWKYLVYGVVAEQAPYFFSYYGVAGTPLQSPRPLSDLPYSFKSQGISGPFWPDHNTNYWVKAAGDNGGSSSIVMRWFYTADADFYFPTEPHQRTLVSTPWLDEYAKTPGTPVDVKYTVFWPDRIPDELVNVLGPKRPVPVLDVGETLVTTKKGLPGVNGECGLEVVYQQAVNNGKGESVQVIDPLKVRRVTVAALPKDVSVETIGGVTYFPKLPPSLYERLTYDGTAHKLEFKGILETPAAGYPWLLPNVITGREKDILLSAEVSGSDAVFRNALGQLVAQSALPIPVERLATGFDSLAVTAGFASGEGYVTLAFANNTNKCDLAAPVRVEILKVSCPLYTGSIRAVKPRNPFNEIITMRFDGDLAGRSDNYHFVWQIHRDVDGRPPLEDSQGWTSFREGDGMNEITVKGSENGRVALSDNWFRCSYQPTQSGNTTCGTAFSAWTRPQLAEGWIKRVLAGVNLFDQCFDDLGNPERKINTLITMISRAGPRWDGNVPLSSASCDDLGLIPLYESVLRRGMSFSIEGSPPFDDAAVNQSLLLAAGKLSDLYMLLGNEAFADASDPTVAVSSDAQYQSTPSSIHSFMGLKDAPTLLEEELVLLRGRDDRFAPSVELPPYNHFIWNFNGGDGAVAYKLNYGIVDWDHSGKSDENDAKKMYPQGHGDAWGHYLSSVKNYYRLLRNPNYSWYPRSEAVLIGGVPVTVDYMHERKFAQAAAAKAKAGADILNLTYRAQYSENPSDQWKGYKDSYQSKKSSDPNASADAKKPEDRAWGLAEWGSRSGQGALLDWVVGNALLPEEHQRYYRITPATLENLNAAAAYKVGFSALTNAMLSRFSFNSDTPTNVLSPDLLRRLAALDGQAFSGRQVFLNSLQGILSSSEMAELAPVILDNSRTSGLPEFVYKTLDALENTFFATQADLEKSILQSLGGNAEIYAQSKNLILQFAQKPGDEPDNFEQKVDRTSVVELREVAANLLQIQLEMDKADSGLNPLGLVKNMMPFDIDPAQLDAGKSHFEQIYERAVTVLNNAISTFNRANSSTAALRRQSDDQQEFDKTVVQREADFRSRMIELFGTPYEDDIGDRGTYKAGYDGPDIYHYSYVDPSALTGLPPVGADGYYVFSTELSSFNPDTQTTGKTNVQFHVANNGFGEIKPPSWKGIRKSPGEIQKARGDLIQAKAAFDRAVLEYGNLIQQIESQRDLLEAQYNLNADEIGLQKQGQAVQQSLNQAIRSSREKQLDYQTKSRMATLIANAMSEAMPKDIIIGLASGGDFLFVPRAAILIAGQVTSEVFSESANRESLVELDSQQAKELAQSQNSIVLTAKRNDFAVTQQLKQLEQLIRTESLQRLDLYTRAESIQQASSGYLSTLGRAQRLQEEFLRFRKETAATTSDKRYKDMAFRIFRNDALQKYRAQFDMAAAYVYMAARSYDFDTGLLGSSTYAGQEFLANIVRTRAIGIIGQDGQPQPLQTASGDGGLANPMARMKGNWFFLKGQLGFYQAHNEETRFSLRRELFRIQPGDAGDKAWRDLLQAHIVPDMQALPEFQRYAKFDPSPTAEPAFVLPFETTIKFGFNFFGWPLGGNDSQYDSSYYATKVRSAGIWFANYNTVGLALTPNVYLLPVGEDVSRTPNANLDGVHEIRQWTIVEQRLPIPFPIGNSDVNSVGWIPSLNTVNGSSVDIRQFSSFRAYNDSGAFTPSQVIKDTRLVGRSIWNTRWLLVIPAGTLNGDRQEALQAFVNGPLVNGKRSGKGVNDILLLFQTYSTSGF